MSMGIRSENIVGLGYCCGALDMDVVLGYCCGAWILLWGLDTVVGF